SSGTSSRACPFPNEPRAVRRVSMLSGERSIRISTSSVVRMKPFSATATPPTMMNLTLARARLTNNFSYGVSIVGRVRISETVRESIEAIEAVPDVVGRGLTDDLFQLLGFRRLDHFTSDSFFTSIRLSHS